MVKIYENLNIMEALLEAGLDELLMKMKDAGLLEMLESAENITIFAPTDEAFEEIREIFPKGFLNRADREKLANILKYHVISSVLPSEAVMSFDDIETMNGKKARIFTRDAATLINDAEIIETDIKTQNGIIHKINKVLIPE